LVLYIYRDQFLNGSSEAMNWLFKALVLVSVWSTMWLLCWYYFSCVHQTS